MLRSILLFLLGAPFLVNGQELSYMQYNIKDGLAGSVVYSITQDREGFIWFATETGVSRFDGTRFTNFSTLEGMPDNEILEICADSKGRVWMAPFKSTVCYYYKGKIYTAENDALLKKITLDSYLISITTNKEGDVLLQSHKNLWLIKNDGRLLRFPIEAGSSDLYIKAGSRTDRQFWVQRDTSLFLLSDAGLKFSQQLDSGSTAFVTEDFKNDMLVWCKIKKVKNGYDARHIVKLENTGNRYSLPFNLTISKIRILNDSLVMACAKKGTFLFNSNRPGQIFPFLQNQSVNDALIDHEGSLWFCTMGEGVFKLNSEHIRNLTLMETAADRTASITAIEKTSDGLLLGTQLNVIYKLKHIGDNISAEPVIKQFSNSLSAVVDIEVVPGGGIYFGDGENLIHLSKDYHVKSYLTRLAVKKIHYEQDKLYVASGVNVLKLDAPTGRVLDTLWHSRATNTFADGDILYICTLNGLYKLKTGAKAEYLGDRHPLLKSRITAMAKAKDGSLWITSFGNGVIQLKNSEVTQHITTRNGLTSNTCKNLFLYHNDLWVGTDKGLNKINLAAPDLPITKFTVTDGLASNNINSLLVTDSVVYVGSPAGLTYFREGLLGSKSKCLLRITNIQQNDIQLPTDTSHFELPHQSKNIRFDFVGISFRSAGDIQYEYRLLGLDSNWKTTRDNFLIYPTLPSGEYRLQIKAINKFGVSSQQAEIPFSIRALIWEKRWFQLIVAVLISLLITLLVFYLVKRVRNREEEKTRINSRIAELEQLALKAQMNPHFIFNSLNSIQQYVMDKDVAGANRFISGFSRLIRQTLDFSSRPFVQLTDEIGYLSTYLDLEKNRLEGKFSYTVTLAPELNMASYYVPPMIIQPYLENSVRHGIRFRKDNNGVVKVDVFKKGTRIICVVEDNGVGRAMAAVYKTAHPIEYQSKGMNLTADRIDLINRGRADKVEVQIEDLFNAAGEAAGTRVSISFSDSFGHG